MSLSFTGIWSAFLKKEMVLQSDTGVGRALAMSSGWILHICTLHVSQHWQRKAARKNCRNRAEIRMSLGSGNEVTRSFKTVGVVFGGVGNGLIADKGKKWTQTVSEIFTFFTDGNIWGESLLWGRIRRSGCRTCWVLSPLFKWRDPEGSVNN